MKRRHLGLYVLSATILVVGAMAFSVHVTSLWILALVAACLLMTIINQPRARSNTEAPNARYSAPC